MTTIWERRTSRFTDAIPFPYSINNCIGTNSIQKPSCSSPRRRHLRWVTRWHHVPFVNSMSLDIDLVFVITHRWKFMCVNCSTMSSTLHYQHIPWRSTMASSEVRNVLARWLATRLCLSQRTSRMAARVCSIWSRDSTAHQRSRQVKSAPRIRPPRDPLAFVARIPAWNRILRNKMPGARFESRPITAKDAGWGERPASFEQSLEVTIQS